MTGPWTFVVFRPDGANGSGGARDVDTLAVMVVAALRTSPPGTEVRCQSASCPHVGLRFWIGADGEPRSAAVAAS